MRPAGIYIDRVFLATTMAKKRMTKRELAKRTKLQYEHLCAVCRGERPTSVFSARKISSAIGVSLIALFESNGK